MDKSTLEKRRDDLRKVVEDFENDMESKVRSVLKGLSKEQLNMICGVGGYTLTIRDEGECNIMRFIDDFEGMELLPTYGVEGSDEIIIRFDDLTVTQLMNVLDIAVLHL